MYILIINIKKLFNTFFIFIHFIHLYNQSEILSIRIIASQSKTYSKNKNK